VPGLGASGRRATRRRRSDIKPQNSPAEFERDLIRERSAKVASAPWPMASSSAASPSSRPTRRRDLTDLSSIPKQLDAIVPHLAVPVQPLLQDSSRPYAMFKHYWKYDRVLPVCRYEGLEPLLATLAARVVAPPAEAKVKALEERRRMIEAELTKAST
jgi:hypothetical protein